MALDQVSQPLHYYYLQSNHSLLKVGGGAVLCLVESLAASLGLYPLDVNRASPDHVTQKCLHTFSDVLWKEKVPLLRITDLEHAILSNLEAYLSGGEAAAGMETFMQSHSDALWASLPAPPRLPISHQPSVTTKVRTKGKVLASVAKFKGTLKNSVVKINKYLMPSFLKIRIYVKLP